MDNLMVQKLDQNLDDLSQNLPILDILLYLRVADIFDTNDYELVMNDSVHRTSAEKRIKIVDTLKTRQPRAYWMFTHYIKESCPQNFASLHDIDVEPGCTVCKDTNDDDHLHDCQYQHYCQGLLNIFTQTEPGKFIGNMEELVDFLNRKDQSYKELQADSISREKEIHKLRRDIDDMRLRHTDHQSMKNDEIQAERQRSENALQSQIKTKEENDNLKETLLTNQNLIKELEQQVKEFREKYEKAESLLDQQTVDPLYMNREEYLQHQKKKLEMKCDQAEETIKQKNEELAKEREKNRALERKKEYANDMIIRLREEMEHTSKELEKKAEDSQKRFRESEDRVKELERDIGNQRQHSDESSGERSNLVNTIWEKEKKLRECRDTIKRLENDYNYLKSQEISTFDQINILKESNQRINAQFTEAIKSQNNLQNEIRKLIKAKDDLHAEYMKLQDNEERSQERLQQVNVEKKGIVESLRDLQNKFDNISRSQTRLSGKFGVRFAIKSGPILINQSKIFISQIDHNSGAGPLGDLRIGDYVISINDVNVQEGTKNDVEILESQCRQSLKLVLRSVAPITRSEHEITMYPDMESLQNMGLQLSLVMKRASNRPNHTCIKNGDILLKFNGGDTRNLSLNDIQNKIAEKLRKKKDIKMVVSREQEEVYAPIRLPPVVDTGVRPTIYEDSFQAPPPYGEVVNNEHERQSSSSSASFSFSENSSYRTRVSPDNSPNHRSSQGFQASRLQSHRSVDAPSQYSRLDRVKQDRVKQDRSLSLNEIDQMPYRHSDSISRMSSRISRSSAGSSNESNVESNRLDDCIEVSEQRGDYHYVTMQNIATRNAAPEPTRDDHEYESKLIVITKEELEKTGIEIAGGNKIGIYVKSVKVGSPAHSKGIQVGWRIREINKKKLDKIALCYAYEYLLCQEWRKSIEFCFECVPREKYEKAMKMTSYDYFFIEALVDYEPLAGINQLRFHKGDKLCVINSRVTIQDSYCWEISKQNEFSGESIRGYVPRQLSAISPSSINEHRYEAIDNGSAQVNMSSQRPNIRFYYKLLDDVGELLVDHSPSR